MRSFVAGVCVLYLVVLAGTPSEAWVLLEGRDQCPPFTVVSWLSPGQWDRALVHGHRVIGEDFLRLYGANVSLSSTPLGDRVHAWALRDATWTSPDGHRLELSPLVRDTGSFAVAGMMAPADEAQVRARLREVSPAQEPAFVRSDAPVAQGYVLLQGPALDLDAFVASWGIPDGGLQVEVGNVFELASAGQVLHWSGPRGELEVRLILDLVEYNIFPQGAMVDSLDRTMYTLEGHVGRSSAAAAAATQVTKLGLAPPGDLTWSNFYDCSPDHPWRIGSPNP